MPAEVTVHHGSIIGRDPQGRDVWRFGATVDGRFGYCNQAAYPGASESDAAWGLKIRLEQEPQLLEGVVFAPGGAPAGGGDPGGGPGGDAPGDGHEGPGPGEDTDDRRRRRRQTNAWVVALTEGSRQTYHCSAVTMPVYQGYTPDAQRDPGYSPST